MHANCLRRCKRDCNSLPHSSNSQAKNAHFELFLISPCFQKLSKAKALQSLVTGKGLSPLSYKQQIYSRSTFKTVGEVLKLSKHKRTIIESSWKHCGKMKYCSLWAICLFAQKIFKGRLLQMRQKGSTCVKGLIIFLPLQHWPVWQCKDS